MPKGAIAKLNKKKPNEISAIMPSRCNKAIARAATLMPGGQLPRGIGKVRMPAKISVWIPNQIVTGFWVRN